MPLRDYLPDDAPEAATLHDYLAVETDDCTHTDLGVDGLDALVHNDHRYPALTAQSVAQQINWQDHDAPDMGEWTVNVEEVTHSMPADAVDIHNTLIAYVAGDMVHGVDGGLRYGVQTRLLAYADEDDDMPTGLHAIVIAPEAHPSTMALAEARRHALGEHLAELPHATVLAPDGHGITSESDDWATNAWTGFCRTLDTIIDRPRVQDALDDTHAEEQ